MHVDFVPPACMHAPHQGIRGTPTPLALTLMKPTRPSLRSTSEAQAIGPLYVLPPACVRACVRAGRVGSGRQALLEHACMHACACMHARHAHTPCLSCQARPAVLSSGRQSITHGNHGRRRRRLLDRVRSIKPLPTAVGTSVLSPRGPQPWGGGGAAMQANLLHGSPQTCAS